MSSTEGVPKGAASVVVDPVAGRFGGSVRLPGSKSLTNRALVLAALAEGRTRLTNPLACDDSRYLCQALGRLGVEVQTEVDAQTGEEVWIIPGSGGDFPVRDASFFLGNAGTATRFLTGVLTIAEGRYVVDGDERMRKRPIGDLVRALGDLGADVRAPTGCPPVHIGPQRLVGGPVHIRGSVSSQFISAILLAAPFARRPVDVRIEGELVSRPYLELTLRAMKAFGARAVFDEGRADGRPAFHVVAGTTYRGREYFVEGDASAASYFWAAAALTGDTVRVEGVGKESAQGDVGAADVLAEMGCHVKKGLDAITVSGPPTFLRGVDANCADMPDVVPTLAVAAAFARGRTRLRGVPHLRFKESDRIKSVATELAKIGVEVRELRDGLEIEGVHGNETSLRPAVIDTWHDHRIAMALAIASLVAPGITIREPQVVTKSYPRFFRDLATLGARSRFLDADGAEIAVEAPGSSS